MKRIALLLVVVMSTMWLVRTASADEGHFVRMRGVITMVGDGGIVLHTERGDVRIEVTENTRIERNGHRARLGDLQVRDHAQVVSRVVRRGDEKHFIARSIRARGE